jgi:polyisoprenoid-binding protein YceI
MRADRTRRRNRIASTTGPIIALFTAVTAVTAITAATTQPSPARPPAAAAPAPGEEITVHLDPEASRITFTLGATLHTVEGSFQLTEGEIRFDPATGEASGRVVVDAASGDTGNDKRDRDMHAKVLESDTHPRFILTPERVEGSFSPEGASQIVLHGSLEIHGGTHPVALSAEVRTANGRVEADGRLEVPYVEWGMEDPSKFILRVEKSVAVEVHAVGRLAAGAEEEAETGAGEPAAGDSSATENAPDEPGG